MESCAVWNVDKDMEDIIADFTDIPSNMIEQKLIRRS